MLARTPLRETLPDLLPVFPLSGALLLPHGRLPLNIFEPRYLAMIEDALATGRHIGMIQPSSTAPAGPHGPALQQVGCIGRLVAFAETDDGRFLITLGGVMRFVVAEEVDMCRGYRRVRGEFTAYTDDLAPLPDITNGPDRAAMLDALKPYFARLGVDANWTALEKMSDAVLVVTLGMGCPFEPMAKQALLEAATLAERAETLLALLRIDGHGASGDADDGPRRPS